MKFNSFKKKISSFFTITLIILHIYLTTSITLPIKQFLDRADQLILNRLHSPIFTVRAPAFFGQNEFTGGKRTKAAGFNERVDELKQIFLGSIFLTTLNATLALSTTHGGEKIQCMYYPDAHPLSPHIHQGQYDESGRDAEGRKIFHVKNNQKQDLDHEVKLTEPIPISVDITLTQSEVPYNDLNAVQPQKSFREHWLENQQKNRDGKNNKYNATNQTPPTSRNPLFPYTAQFVPYSTGVYDSAFISSSNGLYQYFDSVDINDMAWNWGLYANDEAFSYDHKNDDNNNDKKGENGQNGENGKNNYNLFNNNQRIPQEPLPWDLIDYALDPVSSTIRRDLVLKFIISLESENAWAIQEMLKKIKKDTMGFVLCKDFMFSTDNIKSLKDQLVVNMFGYDKSHYAVLYENQISLTHQNVNFNDKKKQLTQNLSISLHSIDHINVENFHRGNTRLRQLTLLDPPIQFSRYIDILPIATTLSSNGITALATQSPGRITQPNITQQLVHRIFIAPKTMVQFLSYRDQVWKTHLETYLPFLRYMDHIKKFTYQVNVDYEQIVHRPEAIVPNNQQNDNSANAQKNKINEKNTNTNLKNKGTNANLFLSLRPQCTVPSQYEYRGPDGVAAVNFAGVPKHFRSGMKRHFRGHLTPVQFFLEYPELDYYFRSYIGDVGDDWLCDAADLNFDFAHKIPGYNTRPIDNNKKKKKKKKEKGPSRNRAAQQAGTLGAIGSRTIILTSHLSPDIQGVTFNLSYSVKYIDIVKHLSWSSIVNNAITPSTLHHYDIMSFNGLPSLNQQLDHFDYRSQLYRTHWHFFTFQNFSISYPTHQQSIFTTPLIDSAHNINVDMDGNNKNNNNVVHQVISDRKSAQQCPNNTSKSNQQSIEQLYGFQYQQVHYLESGNSSAKYDHHPAHIAFQSTPLTPNLPIPDSLMRTLSPKMQKLVMKQLSVSVAKKQSGELQNDLDQSRFHFINHYELKEASYNNIGYGHLLNEDMARARGDMQEIQLTQKEKNLLRSIQLFEWGLTIPRSPLCPSITLEDFNPYVSPVALRGDVFEGYGPGSSGASISTTSSSTREHQVPSTSTTHSNIKSTVDAIARQSQHEKKSATSPSTTAIKSRTTTTQPSTSSTISSKPSSAETKEDISNDNDLLLDNLPPLQRMKIIIWLDCILSLQ